MTTPEKSETQYPPPPGQLMGYKMQARVLDFPGGMPGDVGLFIGW